MDMRFNLCDNTLYYLGTNTYQNSLVSDRYSKYFEWTKDRFDLPTFYTHETMLTLKQNKAVENNVILFESSAIISAYEKFAYNNRNDFNIIYTHSSQILNSANNARWIPGGGCWVGTEFGGCDAEVYPKTKLCSFTSSDKVMCQLHRMRLESWKFLRAKSNHIDYYGTLSTGFVKPEAYLKDYMFSIIFENYIDEMYFTEKILNCFATGTIPVYIGASNIGSVFNTNGIIQFKDLRDLISIVNDGISKEIYDSKLDAIKYNFEKAKQFCCIEDYMWENYMEKIYGNRNSIE